MEIEIWISGVMRNFCLLNLKIWTEKNKRIIIETEQKPQMLINVVILFKSKPFLTDFFLHVWLERDS